MRRKLSTSYICQRDKPERSSDKACAETGSGGLNWP